MNQYVTGAIIKKLRENKKMTQAQLAEKLCVSDKAVSKWETGKGYPDITLVGPLADALGISVIELLSGNNVTNTNKSHNPLRSRVYVCPICGNIVVAGGEAVISCCGITLVAEEAESGEGCGAGDGGVGGECAHKISYERIEDEYYVTMEHPMTKAHYISCVIALGDYGVHMVKLYPEMDCACRVPVRGVRKIWAICNRDGLYEVRVGRRK